MAWPLNPGAGVGARGRRSWRGPRPAGRARTAARRAGPACTDMKAIRRSWPGRSAHACSSDVFPLPAGAEMIVTRFAGRAGPARRPGRDGRSALAGQAGRSAPSGRRLDHRAISCRHPVSVTPRRSRRSPESGDDLHRPGDGNVTEGEHDFVDPATTRTARLRTGTRGGLRPGPQRAGLLRRPGRAEPVLGHRRHLPVGVPRDARRGGAVRRPADHRAQPAAGRRRDRGGRGCPTR